MGVSIEAKTKLKLLSSLVFCLLVSKASFLYVCNTGVVYYNLHQDHENEDVLLRERMTRHVFTVEEILQFPDDYHTKGVLSLPYGDIVEPFEAWYSKTKKMSRIDYYDGKLNRDIVKKRFSSCSCYFFVFLVQGSRDCQNSRERSPPFSVWPGICINWSYLLLSFHIGLTTMDNAVFLRH